MTEGDTLSNYIGDVVGGEEWSRPYKVNNMSGFNSQEAGREMGRKKNRAEFPVEGWSLTK